jgi:hypothetical protein
VRTLRQHCSALGPGDLGTPFLDWYPWRRTPRDSVCFTHFPEVFRNHKAAGNTPGKCVKHPAGAKPTGGAKHPGKMRISLHIGDAFLGLYRA